MNEIVSPFECKELQSNLKNNTQLPLPEKFNSLIEEREHKKKRLVSALKIFSRCGFDEGVAGHITVRDPEHLESFWVNPFGMHFSVVETSDLIRVTHEGEIVEGHHPVNAAAFAIHSRIHMAHPDINAACHTHSIYGKAWSSFGKTLDLITQDSCAFYKDHEVFKKYSGLVLETDEGDEIAKMLRFNKALILQNHGLLTTGKFVESAAWWFITMERTCQAQLLVEAASKNNLNSNIICNEAAKKAYDIIGNEEAGWFSFQPLLKKLHKEFPELK
jgi:ribulose-5-phosphate 4-epimerase/fuculose-1-phosphate aldolase